MPTVLALATLQSFFLAILIASKPGRRLPDRMLAGWLALMGTHTGIYLVLAHLGTIHPILNTLNSGFPFLQGPLLFIYIDILTAPRRRLRFSYLWHAIPFAAFVAYPWLGPTPATSAGTATRHIFAISSVFNVVLLASVPSYIAWSLLLIRRYRARLADAVSTADRIDLAWPRTLIIGLGGVWAVVLVTFVLGAIEGSERSPSHGIFWAVTIFVYAIGFVALRHTDAVSEPVAEILRETAGGRAEAAGKYRRSGLRDAAADSLHTRLRQLMEEKRFFLDDALDLPGLARALETTPNHLSQIINGFEGKSFFDFVNGYRVESVKARLAQAPESNLLEVGLGCGFRSKSTFNRIFKQHTGKTPSQYRDALDVGA